VRLFVAVKRGKVKELSPEELAERLQQLEAIAQLVKLQARKQN